MANKAAILQSDMTVEQKALALLLCVAQEKKAEITRLIRDTGLSILQLNLLHALDKGPEGGLTVNQLKGLMADESPNVSRALNKLVDSGYVTKHRSENDQRIVHIRITPSGARAHLDADSRLLTLPSPLTEQDSEQLFRLLQKL